MKIEIPEGYEARIEGNEVVLEPKENEDERIKEELISFLRTGQPYFCPNTNKRGEWANWVEKQKEQKPAEWSEEDEAAYGDLIWCFEQAMKSAKDENEMGNIWFAENWVKNRLKSLCLFGDYHKGFIAGFNKAKEMHYNAWKPSEEQMKTLKCLPGLLRDFKLDTSAQMLEVLYEQLKKL